MKTAYLDCFSGISGDMFLGTLLDAGLPFIELERAIASLPFTGYSLDVEREKKNGLMATRFIVGLTGETHKHRRLKDVIKIINEGDFSDSVKQKSVHVFESIAIEEGKIHNHSPEKVHFHEVGAIDSIIDIVGTAFGIECLEITTIYASQLPLGSGFTETGHGRIPIPAPATLALLKGVPVYDSGLKYELVTPTGAALLREFVDTFGKMPPMTIDSVGYGAGSRELPDRPNLLRILLGKELREEQTETVVILDANLDDTSPEWLGFLMDRLFESGALDVIFCPIHMKKNRPGIQVQVMAEPHRMDVLVNILFRESTTLGIRYRYSQRRILKRTEKEIHSPWGKLKVKKVIGPDGSSFLQPEYESCRRIAEENNLPLKEVYYWVMSKNST